MPDVEVALLADYVREQGGVFHVVGGGFDTIMAPDVPVPVNLGLLALIAFEDDEVGEAWRIDLRLREREQVLFQGQTEVTPQRPDGLPEGWPVRGNIVMNLGLLMPRYAVYAFELLIADEIAKTLNLRVVRPPDAT